MGSSGLNRIAYGRDAGVDPDPGAGGQLVALADLGAVTDDDAVEHHARHRRRHRAPTTESRTVAPSPTTAPSSSTLPSTEARAPTDAPAPTVVPPLSTASSADGRAGQHQPLPDRAGQRG